MATSKRPRTLEDLSDSPQVQHPVALDSSGKLVSARSTDTSQAPFQCVTCESRMVLRSGTVRTPHFSHLGETTHGCSMSGETSSHYEAKISIRDSNRPLRFYVPCRACKTEYASELVVDCRPPIQVVLEHQVGRFRVDVAVLDGSDVTCAIEVLVTHKVPEDKWRELGVPLIEVEAKSIEQSMSLSKPIEATRIKDMPLVCNRCRQLLLHRLEFGMYRGKYLFEVDTRYLFDFLADMNKRVEGFIQDLFMNGSCYDCNSGTITSSTCWCQSVISEKRHSLRYRKLAASYDQISERAYVKRFIYLLRFHAEIVTAAKELLRRCISARSICVSCRRPTEENRRFCFPCWRKVNDGDTPHYSPLISTEVMESLREMQP